MALRRKVQENCPVLSEPLDSGPDPLEPSAPPPSYTPRPDLNVPVGPGDRDIQDPDLPPSPDLPPQQALHPQPDPQASFSPPLQSRLRHRPDKPAAILPLRHTLTAQLPDDQGFPRPPITHLVYTPFSTTDIYNWKTNCPPFSEKPQATIDLLTSIFQTHLPTWADCQQLLVCLLSTEERRRALSEARKHAQTLASVDPNPDNWLTIHFPDTDPSWQPDQPAHMTLLDSYRKYIIQGLVQSSRKPINVTRVAEIMQKPDESPAAFLERLTEAYRTYTPFDPELPENLRMVNTSFVSQAQPDIRRKLQKQEGFAGMTTTQLLEIAQRVFMNRDTAARREADRCLRRKADLFALALRTPYKSPSGEPAPHPAVPSYLLTVPPDLWAESGSPGLAHNIPPFVIDLKPAATPVSIKQYHIPKRALTSIIVHLDRLARDGFIRPCTSPWNTPLLPVLKPGDPPDYRPVQDLRAVNSRTTDIHPLVPNPYTLLSHIPPSATVFTVLDLKDAFFCCRLAPVSQPIFAFERPDPDPSRSPTQATWTRLPQGFKNSPTLFSTALAQDLSSFSLPPPACLLQYIDDLLLCCPDLSSAHTHTLSLLLHLYDCGYRVSLKKAQFSLPSVTYLGFTISQGQRSLPPDRAEALCSLPTPTDRKSLRTFLGIAGYCRLWIPDFATLAKPLYEATKGPDRSPFLWTSAQQKAHDSLRSALLSAPALGLPDPEKPFHLYCHERSGIASGVLLQTLGSWKRPAAYLSRQLDPVASGWPPCLRAVAAAADLVAHASKFTFGQHLTVHVPHDVLSLLDYRAHLWLSNERLLKYTALFSENPTLSLVLMESAKPTTAWEVERRQLAEAMRESERTQMDLWKADQTAQQTRHAELLHMLGEQVQAMHKLAQWQVTEPTTSAPVGASFGEPIRLNKLAPEDEMEDFLLAFERVAGASHWPQDQWAIKLIPCLAGQALEAYRTLNAEQASDYKCLKEVLLEYLGHTPEQTFEVINGFSAQRSPAWAYSTWERMQYLVGGLLLTGQSLRIPAEPACFGSLQEVRVCPPGSSLSADSVKGLSTGFVVLE
uniref:ribonuclease H n=1 Tax=Geotrypetes seraphini TaxID=260995 RepID=A0A6P8R4C0_GEOSA|nr:uncharacterized protein LOC117357239 [Geotrypetes seraphini]